MPRPIRHTAVFLLMILLLIWQLKAGQNHWSKVTYSNGNNDPSKPRIAIVTFITGERSYIHLSLRNKVGYAKLHGYDFYVDYEAHATRGVMWHKFDMVERVIKAGQHDWIWWVDFDTLITNTTMSVVVIINESLANSTTPDMIDFFVTNDCNGLNGGSFIVRSSSRSIEFLNAVRSLYDREKSKDNGKMMSEQDTMRDLLESKDPFAKHVMRIPQWKINAFPSDIGCYDEHRRKWERGMFVIHFAGAWAHVVGEDPTGYLMRKYKPQILWGGPTEIQ